MISFIEMGEATHLASTFPLAQANALLAKLPQDSGMNVWLQVHQSLEKDGVQVLYPMTKHVTSS